MSSRDKKNIIEKALSFIQKYQDEHDDIIFSGGDITESSRLLNKKFFGVLRYLEQNNVDEKFFFNFIMISMAIKKMEDKIELEE
jgi:hypothetical protein